jgi:HEAT repeat protein
LELFPSAEAVPFAYVFELALRRFAKKPHGTIEMKLLASALGALVALLPTFGQDKNKVPKKDVAPLLSALSDKDPNIRAIAAKLLADFDFSEDSLAVAPLERALGDANPEVRAFAARALGVRRTIAKSAIPQVIAAMDDPVPNVRQELALALSNLGPGDDQTVPIFVKAIGKGLKDEDARVRQNSALALQVNPKARIDQSLQMLVEALEDNDPAVRKQVIMALSNWRDLAAVAIPSLLKRVADKEHSVRVAAVSALASIDPRDERVVTCLVTHLKDSSKDLRWHAVAGLETVVKERKNEEEIVPALIEMLRKDPDSRVRRVAISVLVSAHDRKKALEAIEEALADSVPMVRIAAVLALSSKPPYSDQFLKKLTEMRDQDESPQVRKYCKDEQTMIEKQIRKKNKPGQ